MVLTALQTQVIQRLPRTTHVWQGDLRTLDKFMPRRPGEEGLKGVFWIDETTAVPRAIHPCVVIDEHQKPDLLLDGLIEALLHPLQGAPGRPRQLIVCRREYQLYLRGVLQTLDIPVEYRPQLGLLDEILVFLGGQVPPLFALDAPPNDLPLEELLSNQEAAGLTDLYQQAVSLWRRAPWDYLTDYPPLALTLNAWGIETLYVCILGAGGMTYGVAFYQRRADVDYLVSQNREDEDDPFICDAFYVHFLSEDETPESLLDDFDTYGWAKPNKNTYTDIGRLVKDQGLRVLGKTEVLIVQTALNALNQFFSKQGRRLREEGDQTICAVCSVSHPQDLTKLTVTIEYTPPEPERLSWIGPVRDDLFLVGMTVLCTVLPWPLVELFEMTGTVISPSARPIQMGTMGLPVVMLTLKARAAKQICQRLFEEGFLGLMFEAQAVDEVMIENILVTTRGGGVYQVCAIAADDVDYPLQLRQFQQAQALCHGGHALIVIKERKGKNLAPQDVIGMFQANRIPQVDFRSRQAQSPE